MSVFRKTGSKFYHYDFVHEGVRRFGSTGCADLDGAREVELALKRTVKGRVDLEIPHRPTSARRVYAAEGQTTKLIKIGSAIDVASRLAALQCGSPDLLRLHMDMPGGRAGEAMLHRALAPFRAHGEWFRPERPVFELLEHARETTITHAVPKWLERRRTLATSQ